MELTIKKLAEVNEFREKLSNDGCYYCPLYSQIREKGYNPVVSRGSGRMMFVGIAPSPDEHFGGTPFQGTIGGVLQSKLKKYVGLDVDTDCYLTNLIKCHPEGVERFQRDEKKKCSMHLAREVELVDPLLIVVFGKDVYRFIGYEDEIQETGEPFQATVFGKKRWIYLMNNPGLIQRDPTSEKTINQQLRSIARWLNKYTTFYKSRPALAAPEEKDEIDVEYRLIDDITKARAMVLEMQSEDPVYLGLDTETTGLDLYQPDFDIVGVSLGVTPKVRYYLPCGHRHRPGTLWQPNIQQLTQEEIHKVLSYLIYDQKLIPILHNFYYDYRVLKQLHTGFVIKPVDPAAQYYFHDSMVLAYLENENERQGLKDQVYVRFGIKPATFKGVSLDKQFQFVPLDKALVYAGDDAGNTLLLFNDAKTNLYPLSTQLTKGKLLNDIYPQELEAARIMADATDRGIAVDMEYLQKLKKSLILDIAEVHDKLDGICNVIDHTSSFQLDKLMKKLLGESDQKEEYVNEFGWAVDEDHLRTLTKFVKAEGEKGGVFVWSGEKLQAYIDLLLTHRRLTKLLSTYVERLLTNAVQDEDGNWIIHGLFNTIRASSGRMSSENPNLQNMPRMAMEPPKKCQHCGADDKNWWSESCELNRVYTCGSCGSKTSNYAADIRKAFIARKGYVFTAADWDSMEMAYCAAVSGDPTLVGIMQGRIKEPDNRKYDMHYVTAAGIYGKSVEDVTKTERQAAKPVNFGAIYGISEFGLIGTLRTMAGITVSQDEAKSMLDGFFVTYPGVLTWFVECKRQLQIHKYITHPQGRIRRVSSNPSNEEIRSATNFVIQGGCASVMKRSIGEIDRNVRSFGAQILSVIHDEIITETPLKHAVEVGEIMERAMNVEVTDKATIQLTATAEAKFNLSKAAKSYSMDEFAKSGLTAA